MATDEREESTILSLVDLAASGDRESLERFLLRYLSLLGVWAQLRFKLSADQAEELAHEFVTKRILDGDLLKHFDPQRGRFRHFLRRAFLNFAGTQLGKDQHRNALLEQAVAHGEFTDQTERPVNDEIADAAWAQSLIESVVKAMHEDCLSKGQEHLWEVFRGRLWQPLLTGQPPRSFESLTKSLCLKDTQQTRLALWTARKKFNNLCIRILFEESGDASRAKKTHEELVAQLLHKQPQQDAILRELFVRYEQQLGEYASLETSSVRVVLLLEKTAASRPEDLPAISAEELVESTVTEFVRDAGTSPLREHERQLPPFARYQTLFDLLIDADADLPTLRLIKDVARGICDGSNSKYSPKLGLAIYYLCLAAVHVHCGRMAIREASSLPQFERRKGFLWLIEQKWLPPRLQALAEQASESMSASADASHETSGETEARAPAS